ncbi:MAG: Maf family protein [Clostridiales bacterium]|nr:Maf family protein [Clostridiales bacterium]
MIILASASPRRHELLRRLGLDFTVIPADINETSHFSKPSEIVCDICLRKALFVAENTKDDDIIISADTLVFIDGTCLGKPENEEDAKQKLKMLSGRHHEVYTGVTVLKNNIADTRYIVTKVHFKNLSDREITGYVKTGEPMDKAGAYGLQGMGALLIEGIEGDYFNAVGLPLKTLNEMLNKVGIFLF